MNPRARSYGVSALFALGLCSVFVGERLIAVGTWRGVFTLVGVLAVLIATSVRVVRLTRAAPSDHRRGVERLLLGLTAIGAAGLLVYFLGSDLIASEGAATPSKLRTVIAVVWPILVAASLLPLLLAELAYAGMIRAPVVEGARVRDAAYSGLGLAFALVFAFTLTYVFTARDAKWDFSYFRTAKAGDSTKALVRSLDAPLQVSLFFPPANEVAEQVSDYFTELQKESPQLQLERFDHAVDVARARELNVTGNGAIVFSRGGRNEQLLVGSELERARNQLRNLDQEAQKRLLMLARQKRTIYLTSGHGERSGQKEATDQRSGITLLRRLLQAQNQDVKDLGIAQGLATEVPQDAAAVLVLGATQTFLPEELAALERYLTRGGRVLLALDPEAKADFAPLLSRVGLTFDPTTLANDAVHVRRTQQVSDRALIGTDSYSSHPSVTALSRLGRSAPMVFLVAGSFEDSKQRPVPSSVDFTVHAESRTFRDGNGNFTFDAGAESRKPYELAAAVTFRAPSGKKEEEGRMIVLADVDALTDLVIENLGNAYFATDGVKWLVGEEAIAGAVTSEEDIPVEHTRKQDVAWFYSTVFLVPVAVLGVGYFASRRRGRKARTPNAPAAEVKR